jgi:Holliday junction resolvasome RuvABC ATP-dependent DNA helicase subunit
MDLRELQKMTVVKLREEAMKHEGLTGVHGMGKTELIAALAPIFGIDLEAQLKAARERMAASKGDVKKEIHALKQQRSDALADHDHDALRQARLAIKKRKRYLRRLAEQNQQALV